MRKNHESDQEWIGRLQTITADCDYNEYDRRLIKQFTHGLDNVDIIRENLKEI